jgi:predicted transcriptional regulator
MSQSTPTRQHALTLLSQGVSPSQAASALGVTESQISQYLSDDDFAAALESQRAAATAEDLAYDEKLDKIEGAYLERIEQKAAFANLQQSLQAFKILNGAKRRKDSRIPQTNSGSGAVVNITIPVSIMPQYITNSQNEIVEVEGQTMVSASPRKLNEMLAQQGRAVQNPTAAIGVTKLQRAQETLQILAPKPQRRAVKHVPSMDELKDLL